MIKKAITVIFLLVLFQLPASTIIVNSIFDAEKQPGATVAAGYVEDGLMDILFDRGFIMFSTFNAGGYQVEGAKDARYMISIEPRESEKSVIWKLNATVNGLLIDEGKIEFSSIPGSGNMGLAKLYYQIGEEVALKVSAFF